MSSAGNREAFDHDLIAATLNRATTLIGASIAVFTFLLFFFYPRFSSSQIDAVLYQVTLGTIVVAIFSFGFSAVFFYEVLSIPEMDVTRKRAGARRGNILFMFGVLAAVSEPALILFTLGLEVVGFLAAGLWLVFTLYILLQAREQERTRRRSS